ncbi:hypothetical protein SNE25_23770 [Mucilaginibacter sabulilitoris]|uniref:Uncharacterized protein n=1 Tax=Mucilaginibacter sabulilitoris TaxID=1173583 RepID=A0ABZ0TIV9_9SPHI|nr:hypothetical protein [Mucilaginibacter sabulilitoris]WPU92347.1 hypothetical protein SNE25_23770 [Mucilaginibacter sabulilitoris]
MEAKDKAKNDAAKEVREQKATKQEKSAAAKAASRSKRRPLL